MTMMTEIPDLAEPIRGYRAWMAPREGLLASLAYGGKWDPGIQQSRCLWGSLGGPSGIHRIGCAGHAGDMGKTCDNNLRLCLMSGIHSYKSLSLLVENEIFGSGLRHSYRVYGEILMWGIVHEHQYGYRAQFAKVDKLYLFDGHGGYKYWRKRKIKKIAKKYDAEVRSIDDVNHMMLSGLF